MNWLDIVLIIILAASVIAGIIRGFIRQLIGIIAVVAGIVIASRYFRQAGVFYGSFINNELLADFLGFITVFFAIVGGGALIGVLLTKLMKGPLAVLNRVGGGALGIIKGVLICGVIVFALLNFKVATAAMETSKTAPVCLGITKAAISLIPTEVKSRFESSYRELQKERGKNGKKI